ncbi:MAG: DUF6383 domain-containing protein [Dysgonamonadaceae bacterium]|nr:DUF6383 domain-containing protein [Dysgonamonadaceae bacterium]
MKKNYFLLAFLPILIVSVTASMAQTYRLHDLSDADFEAGGDTYWSFEKYDVATGTYSTFTTYGDSGRVNYFDRYNPERYASYPIMSNPEVLTDPYPVKRNSWFNDKNEYLYIARDYPEGTACVNLEYWTDIPASLQGYEVYSAPAAVGGTFRNAAITFTVPADGYYKVDMSVIREDNIRVEEMNIIPRFRYEGQTTIPDVSRINQGFAYGKGGTTADDPTIVLPSAPESPEVGLVRYAAQTVTSGDFYIYAKAGDKISFETDARNVYLNNNVRDLWARTKWTNLALTVTDETTAKANPAKFVDPYLDDPAAFAELIDLLDQAEALIQDFTSNTYPVTAFNALQAIFETIDNAYEDIRALEAPGFIEQLRTAINNYLASAYGLKVQYTFDNVTDNVVPDASGSGNDGTLYNESSIIQLGKYNALNLGNGTGYLDMGATVGNVISTMGNYTISAYYRLDENASLSGTGHFLWAFSSQTVNSAGGGQYIYYQLNKQRHTIASSGWNSEKAIERTAEASKGAWQHVAYRQVDTKGELYVNGEKVLESADDNPIPQPLTSFTAATPYNWIARPPFSNDNYLKNTFVYDFRLYNQAVSIEDIVKWAALTGDLDYETNYGSTGDFSELTALIAQYNTFLTTISIGDGVGQYPEIAKQDFEDAITTAQTFATAGEGSQYLVDAKISSLKAAYDTFAATIGIVMLRPASVEEAEYSFEPGLYYIEVGDYYLTMPESGVVNTFTELRPYIGNDEKIHNNQVWNIQYNDTYSDQTRALYSFVSDKVAWEEDGAWHMDEIGRMKEGNTAVTQSETGSNWDWREHRVYFNGTAYSLVNNHNSKAIAFVNETENERPASQDAMKFNFIFRTIDDVVANPKTPNAIQTPEAITNKALIYGAQGEIVVSGADAGSSINVYDISGRLIKTLKTGSNKTRITAASGLYIVKIAGEHPVANKVIVK